jgi:hypothetical protein
LLITFTGDPEGTVLATRALIAECLIDAIVVVTALGQAGIVVTTDDQTAVDDGLLACSSTVAGVGRLDAIDTGRVVADDCVVGIDTV